MKKILFTMLALVLMVGLALPMAVPAGAHLGGRPYITDLLAGQDIDVGNVSVWNDGDNLYITYEITDPDWRITETHLYVGKTDPNTLTTAPGQFPYDDDDADSVTDTMVSYIIPLDEIDDYAMQVTKKAKRTGVMVAEGTPGVEPCNNVYIAAHAVVDTYPLCQSQGIIYGTEQNTGKIYQIDVVAGTAAEIADTGDPAPTNNNSPNGLAFDPVSGRLYFSVTEPATATDCDLYFWNGSVATKAGDLPSVAAGATFYNGVYYYIDNATDDLRQVTLNPDGSVSATSLVCTGFDDPDTYRFGDVVIDPNGPTLFGSSITSGSTPPTFFSVALGTCAYTEISTTDGLGLQIAYGSNGLLYGCAGGSKDFVIIDPTDGSTTSAGTVTGSDHGFTDLASGERCVPEEETAWADGTDFDHKNWATYFIYHVQAMPTGVAGDGWTEVASDFDWEARARHGGAGGWRAFVDDELLWTGGTVPWLNGGQMWFELDYDDSTNDATFTIYDSSDDSVLGTVTDTDVPGFNGLIGIQGKTSPEAAGTVVVDNVEVDGTPVEGDDGFTAQGTDFVRDLKYLTISDVPSGSFTLTGDLTFTWVAATDEGPALSIYIQNNP